MNIKETAGQIMFDMGVDGQLLMRHNKNTGDLFVVINYPGESQSTVILPFDDVSGRMRYWLDHL